MKNFLRNFNWHQAICVTLIALAFILGFASLVLLIFERIIPGCICLIPMLACIFVIAGMTD